MPERIRGLLPQKSISLECTHAVIFYLGVIPVVCAFSVAGKLCPIESLCYLLYYKIPRRKVKCHTHSQFSTQSSRNLGYFGVKAKGSHFPNSLIPTPPLPCWRQSGTWLQPSLPSSSAEAFCFVFLDFHHFQNGRVHSTVDCLPGRHGLNLSTCLWAHGLATSNLLQSLPVDSFNTLCMSPHSYSR